MISYEDSFSVEPLMSSNLGGGFQWPIGTVLSIIKTNSLDHAGNYTCAPSTLISGERKKSPYGLPQTDKSRKSEKNMSRYFENTPLTEISHYFDDFCSG